MEYAPLVTKSLFTCAQSTKVLWNRIYSNTLTPKDGNRNHYIFQQTDESKVPLSKWLLLTGKQVLHLSLQTVSLPFLSCDFNILIVKGIVCHWSNKQRFKKSRSGHSILRQMQVRFNTWNRTICSRQDQWLIKVSTQCTAVNAGYSITQTSECKFYMHAWKICM